MNPSFLILGALAFLRASLIGVEFLPKVDLVIPLSAAEKPKIPIAHSNSLKKSTKPEFSLKSKNEIDIKLFLEEFRRQADEMGLFDCLNLYVSSPYSALFQAVMTRRGKLTSLEVSGIKNPLPDCARELISEMKFPKVAEPMSTESHKIIWRVDW